VLAKMEHSHIVSVYFYNHVPSFQDETMNNLYAEVCRHAVFPAFEGTLLAGFSHIEETK
jgi:hypothetical protein